MRTVVEGERHVKEVFLDVTRRLVAEVAVQRRVRSVEEICAGITMLSNVQSTHEANLENLRAQATVGELKALRGFVVEMEREQIVLQGRTGLKVLKQRETELRKKGMENLTAAEKGEYVAYRWGFRRRRTLPILLPLEASSLAQ